MNILFEEEFLERFARSARFSQGSKIIDKSKNIVIVDLGCGPSIRFFKYLKQTKKLGIIKYIGIDPLLSEKTIKKYTNNKRLKLIKSSLGRKIPLKNNIADYVVGFAFIEHLENPKEIIEEAARITKKGGTIIFASPTPKAKKILEFLAFRLSLFSRQEIAEHKNYFDRESFNKLISGVKNIVYNHKYFELGLNNLFELSKDG